MTQPTPTNPLTKWIGDNLLTIVLGGAVLYAGFTSSDAVTNQRLSDIERRLTEIQAVQAENSVKLDADRSRNACQIRNIEKINDRVGVTPPCQM